MVIFFIATSAAAFVLGIIFGRRKNIHLDARIRREIKHVIEVLTPLAKP